VDPAESRLVIVELSPTAAEARFSGRIDALSVRSQREELHGWITRGITRFVVDLSDVSFLDSAGIAMLVSLLKRTRQVDGDVRVVQPTDAAVRRILKLTRLDLVFQLTDSADEARREIQAP
jgi:anti-anti-sigma factor